jgi:hypothetical protein
MSDSMSENVCVPNPTTGGVPTLLVGTQPGDCEGALDGATKGEREGEGETKEGVGVGDGVGDGCPTQVNVNV